MKRRLFLTALMLVIFLSAGTTCLAYELVTTDESYEFCYAWSTPVNHRNLSSSPDPLSYSISETKYRNVSASFGLKDVVEANIGFTDGSQVTGTFEIQHTVNPCEWYQVNFIWDRHYQAGNIMATWPWGIRIFVGVWSSENWYVQTNSHSGIIPGCTR